MVKLNGTSNYQLLYNELAYYKFFTENTANWVS